MKIPRTPPDFASLMENTPADRLLGIVAGGAGPLVGGEYRHWDTLQYLTPPADLSREEWWLALKLARRQMFRALPLMDRHGRPFVVGLPDPVLESVHRIDRDASGQIAISEQVTEPTTRDRYLVRSIIEEAITSSQLEGAATTRAAAKELLRSGRGPRDRGERMILNNFHGMRFLQEVKDSPLTPDLIFELHRIMTADTLDKPDAAGRLRNEKDDPVYVWDRRDGTLLHEPPPPGELASRLTKMCEFANGRTPGFFIHPVIRAIALHFWIGYDHPFVDGNGRTARALFYWSMSSQGYWLCEFLSISSILRRAPAKYMRAYLYAETDDNDLTYFVSYHLAVIERAIRDLQGYLKRKMEELRETSALLRRSAEFNHRQLALLTHALRHPGTLYTIESHRMSHNVVYQTARTDLLQLANRGLLEQHKIGKKLTFASPENLADRLARSRRPQSRR